MIEELKLIQTIVGDLSSVGGWVVAAIIIYKLIVNLVLFIGGGWLIKTIAQMVYDRCKADITRSEADSLKAESIRAKAQHEAELIALKSKIENVKHMYKILKEAKEHKENE